MIAPFLVLLAAFAPSVPPDLHDTTLVIRNGNANGMLRVDGVDLRMNGGCTLGMTGPQTCIYHLSAPGDTLKALSTWRPRSGTNSFLRMTFNACGTGPMMPGCNTYSDPNFDHAAAWSLKGKTGDWILQIDSVLYESTPFSFRPDSVTGAITMDPGSTTLVIRPRWARVTSGSRWIKWTDTVVVPAWTTAGKIGLDPRRSRTSLLRWIGPTPGNLTDLTCRLRDSSGRMWISASTNVGAPLAAFLALDRDSLQPRLGGMLSNSSPVTVQPLIHSGRQAPVAPVTIAVGGAWDLDVSLGWFGGDQAMHATMPAPGPAAQSSPGWQKLSATWSWTLAGVRDSVVVLGWIPTSTATSVPRMEGASGLVQRRRVDVSGRPLRAEALEPLRGSIGLSAP